jgi:hypothetical protein
VIEPRIYRAAFVPALLALVLTMFSFESRPRPLPQGLAADVLFDGNQAAELATRIAAQAPDRRAGSRGDLATARLVADTFKTRGFGGDGAEPVVQRFTHAGHELVNVVGRRAGASRRQIVIVAARDAATVPEVPGSAADTAALMQLARVYQGRPSRKTLVLASIDGSNLGGVGARELIDVLPGPELVDAVLVMSDLGSATNDGALLQAWSDNPTRAGIALQRTVAESIRQELGSSPGGSGTLGQLAGCRSRSGSARRACCWPRATTRSASPAAASCRRRGTGRPRRSTPTASARSGARRCARSPRSTPGRGPSTARRATSRR